MNCPSCQRPLPDGQSAACPSCGKPLLNAPGAVVSPALPPAQLNWLIFFAVLFAPPLLALLAARGGRPAEGMAAGIALVGGGLAGIACGVLLGRRLSRTAGMRIVLGLIFAAVLSVVCVGMSCVGCLAGGFRLNFQ